MGRILGRKAAGRVKIHPQCCLAPLDSHRTFGALTARDGQGKIVTRMRLDYRNRQVLGRQLAQAQGRTPSSFLIQIVDVTAEREAQQQLSYQAFHDALTGLRNRAWILDMLEVDLRTARRTSRC